MQHSMFPPMGWGHLGWTLTPLKFQALGEGNMEKLFCLGRLGLEEKKGQCSGMRCTGEVAATQRGTDGLGHEADHSFRDFGSYFHTTPQLDPPPKRKVPQPHRKVNLLSRENKIYS